MRRSLRGSAAAVVTALALALALSSCSGSGTASGPGSGEVGDPVSGGTLRAIQMTEPRHFAPYSQTNSSAGATLAANAVFGALIEVDQETGEVDYQMATGLTSDDGGKTLDLKLREGLTFTDGTPYDAEAVKFNWEQLKRPDAPSSLRSQVELIERMEVVDPTTLRLHMVSPQPHYAMGIVETSMNWIASPTALKKGDESFDAEPVGAGPFTLVKWTRQDSMELERNPDYWDAPRPYLDKIVLRTEFDTQQRLNAVTTGAADMVQESNDGTFKQAKEAGMTTIGGRLNGAQVFQFNTRKPPFDDIRARQAVLAALDGEQINMAAYNGEAEVPTTLFREDSPFYSDIKLWEHDPDHAQELLDELAADGKPLRFKITAVPTKDAKIPAESIQAQLSKLDNVEVEVEIVDFAQLSVRSSMRDFEVIIGGSQGLDPDYFLFRTLHSKSPGNLSGINDPALDQALNEGKVALTDEERTEAYAKVQERLVELAPTIWYVRGLSGAVVRQNVQGARTYGSGSLQPDGIWLSK